ncbi:hypothetical protein ACI77I_23440 [Pseudomonas sp. D47]|uniref:hypothetical protein n=1 Tax=Pseudomonas sp. D47 TaxID=3159447 RepID=UPI00387B6DDF
MSFIPIQHQPRILIVERSFELAVVIDRILCSMQQWRICRASEVEESVALNSINNTPFDALITSQSMARGLLQEIQVRNLFIYNFQAAATDLPLAAIECVDLSTGIPDYRALNQFIGTLRVKAKESM